MTVVTGKEGAAKKFASFPRTQSLLVTQLGALMARSAAVAEPDYERTKESSYCANMRGPSGPQAAVGWVGSNAISSTLRQIRAPSVHLG